MKKFLTAAFSLALVLVCLFVLPQEAQAAERTVKASGTCGENLTWTLYDDGEMVISGIGAMADYTWSGDTPWSNYLRFIKTAVIEDGVSTVGNYAFCDCTNLESVTIPDSVIYIGSATFGNCTSLKGIWVSENNTNYSSDSRGVLFYRYRDGATIVRAPATLSGSYIIPDDVTGIGDEAFANCTNLTSVTIPDSVHQMGCTPFYECKNLMGIWVSENNTKYSSDSMGVLFNKDKTILQQVPGALSSYVIPDSVFWIADWAFSHCSSLVSITIPDSVTILGFSAFDNCISLRSITIPDGVTWIRDYTFDNCNSMESVTIGNSVTEIGLGAFSDCTSLTSINIPDNTTSIGDYAFWNCDSLISINIPANVTDIGVDAFQNCDNLAGIWVSEYNANYSSDSGGVLFDKNKTILLQAPRMLSGNYVIPDCVSSIGENAFDSCANLEKVIIGDGVTHICDYAFIHCTNLNCVTLGKKVKAIGLAAFEDCTSLEHITIPDCVAIIGHYAFSDCTKLVSVNIPDSVTSVGVAAFSNCTSLTDVTMGNGFAEISEGMFSNCESMEYITIPGSITIIGSQAFQGCSSLTEICFLGNAPHFEEYADSVYYTFDQVVATAYYPRGNASWTEGVMQNYGGTITWVPYEVEEPEVPEMEWVQATLSLEGNIGINFYVTLNEVLANDAETVMRFTVNGETMDVPLADADFRDGKYIFTCPVSAKNMADDVTAQIFCSQGAVGEAKSMSVRRYAMHMISAGNENIVKLMKAMLNYGAAAQMSFNHNTGDLANKDLSAADKVLAEVDASAYVHSVSGSEAGIRASGITLVLETETAVRVLFTLDGSKTIDQYTFKVDGEVVQPQHRSGNVYFIEIPNIAAQDLDDIYNVTVGGLTVRYGGLSYVNQINNLAAATQLQKDMAKALFAYWNGAENYFNSL